MIGNYSSLFLALFCTLISVGLSNQLITCASLLLIIRKEVFNVAEYIITDGSRFIYRNHSGKYVPTSSEVMADKFSKKQADGVFQNSLPKALKSVFHVQKYDEPPKNVKQVTQTDLDNNTEKVMITDNIQRWLDKVSDLNGLARDALHRKEELLQQLSDVDKELSDVNHYIEFVNLNAAQGYKAYKMIKERRVKRRSIKNELLVLEIILGKKISESVTDEINKAVEGMDNRIYEPRVLKELFDM